MGSDLKIFENLIKEFEPTGKKETADKKKLFEFFISNGLESFNNENYSDGHITGSAFVFDPIEDKLLLLHHKKLNKWFQPGGHSDGSPDIIATAQRELFEETCVKEFTTNSKIFDIDIHKIPAREGKNPEHLHYDVRFLFLTDSNLELIFNDLETRDLKWVETKNMFGFTTKDEAFERIYNKLTNLAKAENI